MIRELSGGSGRLEGGGMCVWESGVKGSSRDGGPDCGGCLFGRLVVHAVVVRE